MSRTALRPVSCLVALACTLAAAWAIAESLPPGTDAEISARLKPFGTSCLEGDTTCGVMAVAASGGSMTGKEVYDKFCFVCHATAVGGAPLFQDAAQWAPRLDKGMDALLRSSIEGLNAMPPQGACMACSDEEMIAAIRYASGSE